MNGIGNLMVFNHNRNGMKGKRIQKHMIRPHRNLGFDRKCFLGKHSNLSMRDGGNFGKIGIVHKNDRAMRNLKRMHSTEVLCACLA